MLRSKSCAPINLFIGKMDTYRSLYEHDVVKKWISLMAIFEVPRKLGTGEWVTLYRCQIEIPMVSSPTSLGYINPLDQYVHPCWSSQLVTMVSRVSSTMLIQVIRELNKPKKLILSYHLGICVFTLNKLVRLKYVKYFVSYHLGICIFIEKYTNT